MSALASGKIAPTGPAPVPAALRSIETTGFAVQHGHIVMQRGQASGRWGEGGRGRVTPDGTAVRPPRTGLYRMLVVMLISVVAHAWWFTLKMQMIRTLNDSRIIGRLSV